MTYQDKQPVYVADVIVPGLSEIVIVGVIVNIQGVIQDNRQYLALNERGRIDFEQIFSELSLWCEQHSFGKPGEIREIAEGPVIYSTSITGYRSIITTSKHVHGEFIDILFDEQNNVLGFHHIP